MKTVINIEWYEEAEDIERQEEEGIERALKMAQEGYISGELIYESEEEYLIGSWSIEKC